jgi:hypothetical protein
MKIPSAESISIVPFPTDSQWDSDTWVFPKAQICEKSLEF